MKLIAACAVLLLGVAIPIVYHDHITSSTVAKVRACASRGGRVQTDFHPHQCIGAKGANSEKND
jgi:hypothetical protein